MNPPDADFPTDLPGIDFPTAMKYMGNCRADFLRFVRGFVRDFSSASHQLEEHLLKGDLNAILMLSHSIKSVAAYIGAGELAASAGQLEKASREQRIEDIPQCAEAFRCHLHIVLCGINAFLNEHPVSPEEEEFPDF